MTTPFNNLMIKAGRNIKAAEHLYDKKYYEISVSRCYYAMFYITEALLLTKKLAFSSHKAVISAFGREFVKPGLFDVKFHKALVGAFGSRQDADYEVEVYFTRHEVKRHIVSAGEFLDAAGRYLTRHAG